MFDFIFSQSTFVYVICSYVRRYVVGYTYKYSYILPVRHAAIRSLIERI